MLEAEEPQHRGVNIVDGGGFRSVERLVAPLIALAVRDAAADPGAAQPVGEHEGIVIAAPSRLGTRHPSELGRPDDKRVVEHAALVEILDEGRRAVGHAAGERPVIALDVLVGIPVAAREAVVVAAPDLYEADAALEEAAGGEALETEVVGLLRGVDLGRPVGLARLHAVHPQDMLRLVGQ